MSSGALAHRYAQAIYQAAAEAGQTNQTYEQLTDFAELLAENQLLNQLFLGKSIVSSQKKQLIAEIFAAEQISLVKNLLYVLIDKGREALFPEIAPLFYSYQQQAAGRTDAQLISAAPLNAEQTQALAAALGKSLQQQVSFSTHIDKSLIAGCKIMIGDEVIDGSVRHQLDTLRRHLATSRV